MSLQPVSETVGAEQSVPTYLVIPYGFRERFIEENQELVKQDGLFIVEVDPMRPVSHQLTEAPFPSKIIPLAPAEWTTEQSNYYLTLIYQGALAYQITQKTYLTAMPLWIENSFKNYTALANCRPINHIPHNPNKRFAVVVGNGPSVDLYMRDIPEDAEVFACWHVAKKLISNGIHVDYVVHIDPYGYDDWQFDFPEDTGFIAAAQASPMFVNLAPPNKLYGYFEPGNVCNAHFAGLHNVPDSHHVVGAVPHCSISCAVYAGHTDIVLLGVDNAWVDGNYEGNIYNEDKTLVNSQGKTIHTYSAFETEANGLSGIPILHPGVKLYQASDIALDVPNIEYKPLKEFHV